MTDRLTEYSISITNSYAVITDFECADKITLKDGRKCILTRLYEDSRSVMMLAVADGDRYILVYDDTDKQMEAIIDGNTLRISIVDGTSYFIFKAV